MIRYAVPSDLELLAVHDRHIAREELEALLLRKRVLVMFQENQLVGWLRYNLFWDNTPFMNLLYILEGFRGRGLGGLLTGFWEAEMKAQGHKMVLTSSLSDERGQFFYRKHGYVDCGSLLLPEEPLEIIFCKNLEDR